MILRNKGLFILVCWCWLSWQNLYALGARKIGVTTLPPMGCLPAAITLFGSDSNECVVRLNSDAVNFNKKLNTTSQSLQKSLSGLKLVLLDIYQPLYDLVTKPSENGTLSNSAKPRKSILSCITHELVLFLWHALHFHRFFWSKEGLLWNRLARDIYIVQSEIRRNVCQCIWVCILGWFSSLWGCKQDFVGWLIGCWHLSHILIPCHIYFGYIYF